MILIEACILGLGVLLVAVCILNTLHDIIRHYSGGSK